MMVKIFTKNKNDKIELSEKELKELLDEAYWDGYRSNSSSYTWTSPFNGWQPYVTTNSGSSITFTTNTSTDTTNLASK